MAKGVNLGELRKAEYSLCCKDLFYLCKFVRTDDEDIGEVRYFPVHYDYLRNANAEIEEHRRVIILKSRRLLLSWLGMLRQLHGAMTAGTGIEGTRDVFRGGVMSIGETEAQYLIERATKVYHRLPDWIKDRNRLVTDNKLLMRFEKGGTVQAFPMKREGPQTFGFTEVFFDEMALQEAARTTWTGMIPTLGRDGYLIAVSTTNGKFNFFYKVWVNENNRYPGLKRVTIHWSENPEHGEDWIEHQRSLLGDQEFARMFELSFSHYAGDRVFPEFDRNIHVYSGDLGVNRILPMLRGWDFGFHYPALLFSQYNNSDQFVFMKEFLRERIGFDRFVRKAKAEENTFFDPLNHPNMHFVDPAGFQPYHSKAESGAVSDVHELKVQYGADAQIRRGAMQVGDRYDEGPRIKEFRRLFSLREDGKPGILIHEDCENMIEGLNGGYCYDEKGGEKPIKNEYSHIMDCSQYTVTGYNRLTNVRYRRLLEAEKGEQEQRKSIKYKRIGFKTGM